jgi:hypothetical protein
MACTETLEESSHMQKGRAAATPDGASCSCGRLFVTDRLATRRTPTTASTTSNWVHGSRSPSSRHIGCAD